MMPGRLFRTICLNLFLFLSLTISVFPARAIELSASTPDLTSFVDSVKDGQAGILRGVYIQGLFALRVVQQPPNNPAYVSVSQGVVTEFHSAKDVGNFGLLAHNYLAGKDFHLLSKNQEVYVIFGDGKIEKYRVKKILRYQTFEPKSTTSNFIDLDSGERLSSTQLFAKVYKGARHLTFQTCIDKDGELSWGRLFVIAEPFIP
jgi:hypothetical protein